MTTKKLELASHELDPAGLWSDHLNKKFFPVFKELIPGMEIVEAPGEFSFTFAYFIFKIEFTWDRNAHFSTSLFKTGKEIRIDGSKKRTLLLDEYVNGEEGKNIIQITEFLTDGKIQLDGSVFFIP